MKRYVWVVSMVAVVAVALFTTGRRRYAATGAGQGAVDPAVAEKRASSAVPVRDPECRKRHELFFAVCAGDRACPRYLPQRSEGYQLIYSPNNRCLLPETRERHSVR